MADLVELRLQLIDLPQDVPEARDLGVRVGDGAGRGARLGGRRHGGLGGQLAGNARQP